MISPYYTDLVVGIDADTWVLMGRDPAGNLCIINSNVTHHDQSASTDNPGNALTHQNDMSRMSIRERISNVLQTLTSTRKENK